MRIITILATLLMFACNKSYKVTNAKSEFIKIENTTESKEINSIIAPYKKHLEKEMNEVLTTLPESIKKEKPESKLTNLIADALFHQTKKDSNKEIDFCIVNYGGIRIPELYAGEITKGLIYELLPFDNFLVIIELDYETVNKLFNTMAKNGGWPISKNVKYAINENTFEANNVLINGKQINKQKTYKVLLPDYVANGGDSCFFLKDVKQNNCNIYLRDAMIKFLKESKTLNLKTDKRITYVK